MKPTEEQKKIASDVMGPEPRESCMVWPSNADLQERIAQALAAEREKAIEDAAQACETMLNPDMDDCCAHHVGGCIDAIRALKEQP